MAISISNGVTLGSSGNSRVLVSEGGDVILADVPLINQSRRHYYVDAINGSDTNDGLTSGAAYKTIQHAVDQIADINQSSPNELSFHNIIHLASGTYTEDVKILSKEFNGSTTNLLLLIEGSKDIFATGTISAIGKSDPDSKKTTGIWNFTASLSNNYAVDELKGYHFALSSSAGPETYSGVIVSNSGSQYYFTSVNRITIEATIPASSSFYIFKPSSKLLNGSFRLAGNNGAVAIKNISFVNDDLNNLNRYFVYDGFSPKGFDTSDATFFASSTEDYYKYNNFNTASYYNTTYQSINTDRVYVIDCDLLPKYSAGVRLGNRALYYNCYASGTFSNTFYAGDIFSDTVSFGGSFTENIGFNFSNMQAASLSLTYVKEGNVTFTNVQAPTPPLKMKHVPASTSSYTSVTLTFNSCRNPTNISADLTTTTLSLTDSYIQLGSVTWNGPFNYRPINAIVNSYIFQNSVTNYITGVMNGADQLIYLGPGCTFNSQYSTFNFDVDLYSRRYSILKPTFAVFSGRIAFNGNPTYTATSVTSSQYDIMLDDIPFKYADLPASNFYSTAHAVNAVNNNYIKYNINPFGYWQGIGGSANSQFELGSTEGRKATRTTGTSLNLNTLAANAHASHIICEIQNAGNCTITLPTISGTTGQNSALNRQYTIKNYSANRTVTLTSSVGEFIETKTIAASGTLRIHALYTNTDGYGWYAF